MIIKKAQYNFVDVFDEKEIGWAGHTRVQVKKRPHAPLRVYYVSGKPLPTNLYIGIAKTLQQKRG